MSEFQGAANKPVRRTRRPVDMHVGMRIRDRRRILGISRNDLAAALGLSVQQVQKYESGDSTVAASRLFEIGRQLSVPASHFFDEMPTAIEGSALPRAVLTAENRPNSREIRQMVLAYRSITNPELRHQLYELARTLARAAEAEQTTASVPGIAVAVVPD
jgi:transcriptional regulator with XRE-family HTH domain